MVETEILRAILVAAAGLFGFFKAWRGFDGPVEAGGFWAETRRAPGSGFSGPKRARPDPQRVAISLINGLLLAVVATLLFKAVL